MASFCFTSRDMQHTNETEEASMATTRQERIDAERTEVTVTVGDRAETFVLCCTNAPQAYDHGNAIELYDGTHTPQGATRPVIERYILVPAGSMEWQRGRNASGLHSLETADLLIDSRDVE